MKSTFQSSWIINDAVGIFLGIAVAAGLLSYESQLLGQPDTALEKAAGLVFAIVGGLIAGSILAWFQWRILKQRYQHLSWVKWWGNTVLAFIAGWVLAIAPSFTFTGENSMQAIPPFGIPEFTVVYGSIIFGAILGALIGFAQWLVLRNHQDKAAPWIGMNVFSWALSLFVITLAGLVFQASNSFREFLLTGVAGGIIAGLCIAGITSYFFRQADSNNTSATA
ncbi:MAG: hypothetical protein KDD02_17740 [Phaeodactylibacter sp.]|nr:hypothetical protein [Phaeodactylibacter sp.]MCB9301275.1 hypothetical protein [Lewinellaceae bacterium]